MVVMVVRMKVKIILVILAGKGMWTLKEVMMMVVRKIRMRMKSPMTALLPGINYWLKSKLLEATEIGEFGAFWLGGTTQVVIVILILIILFLVVLIITIIKSKTILTRATTVTTSMASGTGAT